MLVTAASLRHTNTRALASAYAYTRQSVSCYKDAIGGLGVEGVDYTVVPVGTVNSLDNCKTECSLRFDCKGIETQTERRGLRCELWWNIPVKPGKEDKLYGSTCYLKEDPSDQCTEAHRRPFFGLAGDNVVNIQDGYAESTDNWQDFAQLHEAFGSANEDPSPGLVRKWRIYAIYSMPGYYQQMEQDIQIMFDLQDNEKDIEKGYEAPTFTLPRILTSGNHKAEGYSTWFQFGLGVAGDTNKSDGVAQARVKASDSGSQNNNNANYYASKDLFWAELVAYDCEQ